jgi:hypothetical protein
MSTLSLRLPDSLHERLRAIAAEEGISINQLVTLAAAEKVAAILTVDYLEARARAADLPAFQRILDRVPDRPAEPGDELPGRLDCNRSGEELHEPHPRYGARRPARSSKGKRKR